MKNIVIDLDDTLCRTTAGDYENSKPNLSVINRLKEFAEQGFSICIYTSRNMRTYNGNLGKITAVTLPLIVSWLDRHEVPYDEIRIGKPWCGSDGFYVDDKCIRPSEFISNTYEEIKAILAHEQRN